MSGRLVALAAGAALAGCVMVPVKVADDDPRCTDVTHHMELKAVELTNLRLCGGAACEATVVIAAGLAAASALVSGSVVVVGNVVYWAERQATCHASPPGAIAPDPAAPQ